MEIMREAGLVVRIDAAGNIFGRRSGTEDLPAIVFGSHIDTVREGGRFDGVLGVVAAIACVRSLQSSHAVTRHPLEAVIFANEEGQNYGALCGSRAIVGDISEDDLNRTNQEGQTLREAIRFVGGQPEAIQEAILRPGSLRAYLELHIEQGGDLESLGIPIGTVEGISGIQHIDIRIQGVSNHSGTTGMKIRRDALVAAAEIVLMTRRLAAEEQLCRVSNVGRLQVSPNSINIVPGEVDLTLEFRDIEPENIRRALERMKVETALIATRWDVACQFAPRKLVEPVMADTLVLSAIEDSCASLSLPFHRMPSGAGHDAQMMARIAPMGMIFVPSAGGISHSTQEFTSAEECANGADVLLQTILRIDQSREDHFTGVLKS